MLPMDQRPAPPTSETAAPWGVDPARPHRLSVKVLLALLRRPARNRVQRRILKPLRLMACTFLGSDIQTRWFGEDLYFPHPFGIVIHGRVRMGDRCTIYQNVTIGEDNVSEGVPTLGDDVVVGAGAVILGPVTIGDRARIGANAVVLTDVPADSVAVGIPARIIPPRGA